MSYFRPLIQVLLLAACSQATPDSGEHETSDESQSANSTAQLPNHGVWHPGKEYTYDIQFENDTSLGMGTLAKFSLSGRLQVLTRDQAGNVEAVARVLDAKLTAPNDAAGQRFAVVERELGLPSHFTFDRGAIRAPRLVKDANPFTITLGRTLLAALQLDVAQDTSEPQQWSGLEADASGEYEASYRWLTPGLTLEKRKLRYERVALGQLAPGTGPASVKPEVVESAWTINLQDGHLEQVVGRDVLRLTSFPGVPAQSATSLTLTLLSVAPHDGSDWPDAASVEVASSVIHGRAGNNAAVDVARIGDFTFETALAELERIARDPRAASLVGAKRGEEILEDQREERRDSLAERSKAFGAMAALLRTEPKNVALVAQAIEAGSLARVSLLGALGSAGTEGAQSTLVQLLRNQRLDAAVRRSAALALIRTAEPTAATAAELRTEMRQGQFHQFALYGLGTIARRVAERGDRALADEATGWLLDELRGAESLVERVDALRAIANSGNSMALSAVEPYLTDKNTKLRGAGVDAIRLMNHGSVDGLLRQRLLDDSDRGVQIAAATAIGVRAPNTLLVSTLFDAISGDATADTKLRAIGTLGAWSRSNADARAALERVIKESDHARLREAARVALEPHEATPQPPQLSK